MPEIKYKTISLDKLFDFSITSNGSFLTKQFVNDNKGDIPVYGTSMANSDVTYGYIKDNLENVKYFENCLTINRNGSAGYVFIRYGRFSINSDVTPLVLFDKYKDNIDLNYLKEMIEQVTTEKFSHNRKAGKSGLKEVCIDIPIDENSNFDLKKQKEIIEKYKVIKKHIKDLRNKSEEINEFVVKKFDGYKMKTVDLSFICSSHRGNSKYNKTYMHTHKGSYPVYTGTTDEVAGYIDTFEFNDSVLTYTTDGEYSGTVELLNGKFNIGGHRAYFVFKDQFKNILDLNYLSYAIQYAMDDAIKRGDVPSVTWNQLKDIQIDIPVNSQDIFDIKSQVEISKKYVDILKIKKEINNEINKLISNYIRF